MAGGDSWVPQGSAPAGQSGEAWSVTEESTTLPPVEDERYERRGLLGEGGMGQVFVARDRRLRREVAFKVAKDPKQARAMTREAWVTAQLEHPGIVPVYNAGETADGQLYYTMRLVRGRSLELSLQACQDVAERLELLPHFLDVCQAMAYAHSLGIVHRDLKPANILLGEFGETQVADWGLARPMLDPEGQWEEGPYRPGSGVLGTPRYMAPEQARGERVDPRADVWALGMVLLELASGRGPFESTSGEDTLSRLREGRLAELDPVLDPLPQELQAIARKALQFHPQDRYPSARELAQDVSRYLRGSRVQAHEYSSAELLLRLVKTWRAPLVVGAMALGVLLILALLSSQRIAQERDLAREALAQGDLNLSQALAQQAQNAQAAHARPEAELLAAHSLRYGENALARGVLASYARNKRPTLTRETPLPAACQHTIVELSMDRTRLICASETQISLYAMPDLEPLWTNDLGTQKAHWTQDERIFVLGLDYQVHYLDSSDGQVTATVVSPPFQQSSTLPDGTVIVQDGTRTFPLTPEALAEVGDARIWPLDAHHLSSPLCKHAVPAILVKGRLLQRCFDGTLAWLNSDGSMSDEVLGVIPEAAPFQSSSVQGDRLLLGSISGRLTIVDLNTGEQVGVLDGLNTSASQLRALPGSDSLALVQGERGGTRIWNTRQNTWEGSLPGRPFTITQGLEAGEMYLFDTTLQVWQIPVTSNAMTLTHENGVTAVNVDPLGTYVAASDGGGHLYLREAISGRETDRFAPTLVDPTRTTGVSKDLSFSIDGTQLAFTTIHANNPVRNRGQWEEAGYSTVSYRRIGGLGSGFWGAGYGSGIVLFGPEGREQVPGLPSCFEGESNTDASYVALISLDREIWLLDAKTKTPEQLFSFETAISVDTDTQAESLWVGNTHSICRMNPAGEAQACVELTSSVVELVLSPNEELIAAGLASGDVRIYSAQDLQEIALLRGHTHRTSTLDWSPDSTWLVSGSWDKTVRYWDLRLQYTPADVLIQELESAWSMSLEQALERN
ncbi:MAG: WD40 repeat protein/predicted Ser/Thr protein kinase [Cognaticolwellia sp.]|jgi:WD40 repeat protein/predicted Ser/Thr protein kinase